MDFSGAHAKIGRAHAQLHALHADIADYFGGHAHAIGSHYNAERAEIELYPLGYENAPVVDWGLAVGDILHNLRSALDHLAWQFALEQLGRKPTEKEAKGIQFPIEETPDGFKNARVRAFVSDNHFRYMDRFQPYHAGDKARSQKLAVLGRLNNTDKHRVVHTAALIPNEFEIIFGEQRDVASYGSLEVVFGVPIEPGVPIGRLTDVVASGPNPYIEGEGPTQFSVVFSDPDHPVIHGAPVPRLLGELGEITDGVVATAEAIFTLGIAPQPPDVV